MSKADVRKIERVANSIAVARKFIQFYPPNNANVTSALEHLHFGLQSLSGELEPVAESTAPGESTREGLTLTIDRDLFYHGDDELGLENPALRKLAGELYSLGVKRIHFDLNASVPDLRNFLELTCLPPSRIRDSGGLSALMQQSEIGSIWVGMAEDISLVDREDLPEDLDMVEYLRTRQAMRNPPSASEADMDLPQDEVEDVSDIKDFFLDIAKGSSQKRRYLFKTLSDSKRLAAALTHVYEADTQTSHQGEKLPLHMLRNTLNTIAELIDTLPQETREQIVANMGEAILTADDRARQKVLEESLAEEVGQGGVGDAILKTLPDEAVAETLSSHVRFHQGTENTISNFLEDFSSDPERRDAIQGLVASMLAHSDASQMEEAASVLDINPEIHEGSQPSGELQTVAVDEGERRKVARSLLLNPHELESVVDSVEQDMKSATYLHAGRTLFELFIHPTLYPLSDQTVRLFAEMLLKAVNNGQYAFLGEVLQLVVEEMEAEGQVQIRPAVRKTLQTCSSRGHIDAMVTQLRHCEPQSLDHNRLIYLLDLMGDSAAGLLFLRLEMEESRAMRMFLVSLFVELGEKKLPFLLKKMNSREWYVVRNVVYILGKIGSEAAIDNLVQALKHHDMRVRREALRALALIRGQRAESILMGCLDDEEPVTRRLAAEWLGQMGAKSALPYFVELLESRPKDLQKDSEFAVGVVRAVGLLGGDDELRVLKRFAPRKHVFTGQKKSELSDACVEAIARLEGDEGAIANAASRKHHG